MAFVLLTFILLLIYWVFNHNRMLNLCEMIFLYHLKLFFLHLDSVYFTDAWVLFFCLFVFNCTCMATCGYSCAHKWSSKDSPGDHSLGIIHLVFWVRISHSWNSLNRLYWLAHKAQVSTYLCLPSVGIINVYHHTWLFIDPGAETCIYLLARHSDFTNWYVSTLFWIFVNVLLNHPNILSVNLPWLWHSI